MPRYHLTIKVTCIGVADGLMHMLGYGELEVSRTFLSSFRNICLKILALEISVSALLRIIPQFLSTKNMSEEEEDSFMLKLKGNF